MQLSVVAQGAAALLQLLAAYLIVRPRHLPAQRRFRIVLACGLLLSAASLMVSAVTPATVAAPAWMHSLAVAGSFLIAAGFGVAGPAPQPAESLNLRLRLSAPGLRQAAARLDSMFRNSPDALLLCTREGVIADANHVAETVTGMTHDQLCGTPLDKIIAVLDDTPDRIALSLAGRISGDLSGTREYRVQTSTGRTLWLEVDSKPVVMGEETFVLISARNVTARKATEAQMRGYQARLDLMGDALPALLWSSDLQMRISSIRGQPLAALDPQSASVGANLAEVFRTISPDDDVASLYRRVLGGESVSFRWQAADLTFEGAMVTTLDAGGRPGGVVGIALDVTERERAAAQADEKEKTLHAILDHAPAVVFIKDLEGRLLWVNRQWEIMSRRSRASAIGKNDHELYPADLADAFIANDRQVLISGQPMTFVETVRGRRNTRAYLSSKFPLRRPDGTPYALCAIATDISERIRLEETLRHHRAVLDEAQTMAGLASWELDLRGNSHYWAPQLREMLGTAPDVAADYLVFLSCVHPDDRPALVEKTAASATGDLPFRAEFRVCRSDGSVRWLCSQGRHDKDEQGPTRFYGFTQDITDRREAAESVQRLNTQLEEIVRQRTEQLEHAVEELTALGYAVSHDLRQPLRAIAGHLDLVEQDASVTSSETRHYMTRVHEAVRRMDALIGDLLALSRVSHAKLRRSDVDLYAIAGEIVAELSETEPDRSVQWQIQEQLSAHADSGLVRILLSNLLGNAFKFTRARDGARVEVGCEERDGERVFSIRDNGAGFDEAFSGRLFEPFQRLHEVGQFEGNGIGLATVARIVRRHGGWIRAEGRLGAGATVSFTLPAAGDRPGRSAA